MEWSLENYRLDEIERKFDLPCVICLTEGFYSETDTEGFSQGDIMSIDSKLVLHKVAANFAFNTIGRQLQDQNYVQLAEKEILVPLNYKGKLKVLRGVKNVNSVRELSAEFPRYAKVTENMEVTIEKNVHVTIQAGTVIELDRIFPGHNTEHEEEPDKLVFQFQYLTGDIVVAVPLDVRGKFRTEPDNNEYTLKEAINRYKLPQFIRFVDDKIKHVYTQDLLEGIDNMRTITSETLRLNHLVTQNVLVGHYKPVQENETRDTERFHQRTLAVLPLDNPEICEIKVHVLKDVSKDIYEQVFLVRNVSKTSSAEIVEGSLYIDFVIRPQMKIISHLDTEDEWQKNEDIPPPRPRKPGHLKSQQLVKSNPNTRQKVEVNEDERGYVKFNPAKGIKTDKGRIFQHTNPSEVKPSRHVDSDGYEILDTSIGVWNIPSEMFDHPQPYQRPPHPLPVNSGAESDTNSYSKRSEVKQKPTAHVAPSNSHQGDKTRQFKDLNNVELVQRLQLCGLDEFARFCKKENLNGAFFTNMSKEYLSNEMNLTGIPLSKFLQMRDINWIPLI